MADLPISAGREGLPAARFSQSQAMRLCQWRRKGVRDRTNRQTAPECRFVHPDTGYEPNNGSETFGLCNGANPEFRIR
jgi:hypothetical protein